MSKELKVECGCKPGTPENGWHERRSLECNQAEHAAWQQAMQNWRDSVRRTD